MYLLLFLLLFLSSFPISLILWLRDLNSLCIISYVNDGNKLQNQIIDELMARDGYPIYIRKSILHNIDKNLHKTKLIRYDETEMKKIWLTSSYI